MAGMKAVEIRGGDAGFALHVTERPIPQPVDHEVLIRVHATGVNGHDLHQLHQGGHAITPGESDLPGLEVAGTIDRIGAGVSRWRVGDRVCALLRGGGYAEYAVALAANCLPVPDGWSLEHAAAMPEALFTTWSNVIVDAELPDKGAVLINGGSSGIGLIAIQLLSALGYRVLATARGEEKVALCRQLGAAVAIDSSTAAIAELVLKETDGAGVEVVLDLIGAATMKACIEALATRGRLQIISAVSGFDASLDLFAVLRKQLRISGTLLRPRSPAYKADAARAIEERVWPILGEGRVTPIIDREFPLEQAGAALARMERKEHLGKLLLISGR